MITNKIAVLYAKALFNLTDTADNAAAYSLLKAMEQLVDIVTGEPAISRFFFSPEVSHKQKELLIEENFSGYCDPLLIRFLIVLLERRRFTYLSHIAKEYRGMVDKKFGVEQGRLITPEPVESATKEKLEKKWEKLYGTKLELREEIDPSLIGGGILLVADHQIDFSIKGQLSKLKKNLLAKT